MIKLKIGEFIINFNKMNTIKNEFVSNEQKEYRFKVGHLVASSLSGLIAGAIIASAIWYVAFHAFLG